MIHELKFTAQEMETLAEVLERRQRELEVEVAHTEALRTKADLRNYAHTVDRLVERVHGEIEAKKQTA